MRPVLTLLAVLLPVAAAVAAPALLAAPAAPGIVRVEAQKQDAEDDADFLFRLGMMEGHLIVGHELLQAHQNALALPHFGHPVREIYDDITDYLDSRKFPAFNGQLVALEARVAAAPDSPDTEKRYQDVIATIHRARDLAPAELRASVPEMIKLCTDVMDAASGEYGESIEQGRIASVVEYHDSRGYLAYVQQQLAALQTADPGAQFQPLFDRVKAALGKAQWIVGQLLPDATPRASVADYRAIVAEAAGNAKQ